MKTRVPGSLVFFALLLTFAVEHFAFLPPVRGQAAQAGTAVSAQPRVGAETQRLRGHVPAVLARLQPIDRLAATNRLNLAIGLPLRNQDALARFLEQLRDPAHPNYRQYLTPEEFAARFGPTEQDYQAIIAFAQANGLAVRSTHHNRMLLDVSGSVADIERALHLTRLSLLEGGFDFFRGHWQRVSSGFEGLLGETRFGADPPSSRGIGGRDRV